MTDELDPKLQDFEAKLRRMKPLESEKVGCLPPGGNVGDSRLWSGERPPNFQCGVPHATARRSVAYQPVCVLVAAAAVLAIICLIPQPNTIPLTPPASNLQSEPSSLQPPASSLALRQQLALLLDEMAVANPVAETKPEYPVVEIVVCDSPLPRNVAPSFGRMRLRGDEINYF